MWIKKLRTHDLLSQAQSFGDEEHTERWFGLFAVAAAVATFLVVWFITG